MDDDGDIIQMSYTCDIFYEMKKHDVLGDS